MWEIKKSQRNNVVMILEYQDFASIEVTKKEKGPLFEYTINVNIFDVLESQVSAYELKEVEMKLTAIKKQIEELYEDIPLFDNDELDRWITDFEDTFNS